jgi:hypothetical protein
LDFDSAREQGLLDRGAASQLMIITDDDYARGMERLASERPSLRSDVRLFATIAW